MDNSILEQHTNQNLIFSQGWKVFTGSISDVLQIIQSDVYKTLTLNGFTQLIRGFVAFDIAFGYCRVVFIRPTLINLL